MAKNYRDDPLKGLNLLEDDDDVMLLDMDEGEFFESGKKSARRSQPRYEDEYEGGRAPKKKSAKKRGKSSRNEDYSGSSAGKVIVVILLLLVIVIGGALFTMQRMGGDPSKLMFWKNLPGQEQTVAPAESETPAEASESASAEPAESETPAESAEPAQESETPAESGAPVAQDLALLQTVESGFKPNLVSVNNLGAQQAGGNHEVDASAAKQLEKFISAAREKGYSVMLSDCYVEDGGATVAAQEHATGLAVDLVDVDHQVKSVFASDCKEILTWLAENAPEYGFIQRFPESKEKETGVMNTTYQFDYVGTAVAKEMAENDWCLEEYLAH